MFKKSWAWLRRKIGRRAANLFLYSERFQHKTFLLPLFTSRDKNLDRSFDKVFQRAISKGFAINKPLVVRVVPGLNDILKTRGGREFKTLAQAFGQKNLIIVYISFDGRFKETQVLPEMLTAIVLAHELGHIVDYQTKRRGHPLFDKIRSKESEVFADAFAAYIYSKLAVVSLYEVITNPYFSALKRAQLDLNC